MNLGYLLFYLVLAAALFVLACGLEWLAIHWHERFRKPRR